MIEMHEQLFCFNAIQYIYIYVCVFKIYKWLLLTGYIKHAISTTSHSFSRFSN